MSRGYNILSSGKPTYWPSDPNRLSDLLDFFVTKGLTNSYCTIEECWDLSSDHTPVTATIGSSIIKKERAPTICNKKTNWILFKKNLEDNLNTKISLKTEEDIEKAIEHFNEIIQDSAWLSTPKIHHQETLINYPIEIREKLKEKRRLRKIWQRSQYPGDKLAFNRTS